MDAAPSHFWIFQAVRERYDLGKRLAPGKAENWLVSSSADEVASGDIAYLWQAGQEDALWGWARVATPPTAAPLVKQARSSSQEQTSARVELVYEVRFEKPVSRRDVRADQGLKALPVLQTAAGTNFLLTPAQAVALAELLRRKGLDGPPEGAPSAQATPTVSTAEGAVGWDDLSPPAQDVLAWANASEQASGRVGTRGVLIGLLRTSHPSEATQLLAYCGTRPEEVFEALQEVRREVRIDPTVGSPAPLMALPELTPNAEKLLETASALRSGSLRAIEPRHLFGAVLEIDESRARAALAQVLAGRIELETVQATYPEYLSVAETETYGDFLRRRFAGARPSTAITSDTWTDRDQLEHELYADAIARFILNRKTKAPLTIGIKAPWGAGKTSLMRMIRKRLDPPKEGGRHETRRLTIFEVLRKTRARNQAEASHALEQDVRTYTTTIWFNAWKYQSSEQLWAGLAHAILAQVGDRMSPIDRDRLWASVQVRRLRLADVRRSFYRYIFARLLPYAIVAPVAAAGVAIAWTIDPGVLKGASVLAAILTVISLGTGTVRSAMDEVTKAMPQLVEEPDYESRLGFLHLVDTDMHRILEVAGATAENPFVVFIDDLDRCSYTTVAQVIEALNVFLAGDFDNCIFVIAMEPDLVAAQIHIAYKELFQRLNEDDDSDLGWRFLEKMVQLPLSLPEPGGQQVNNFLDSILVEAGSQVAPLADDAPEVERAREAIRDAQSTGALEEIPDALEKVREQARASGTATASLEVALQKAARLEFEDAFSDAHAREMLKRHAADLSGNPREIKRFINVFRFYAYIDFWRRTEGFETPGLEGAAKLARIAIGWPSLLSALAKYHTEDGTTQPLLAYLESANGNDQRWQELVALAPKRNRAQLALPELRAVIRKNPRVGENVAGFL
jgi:hypothetical protein